MSVFSQITLIIRLDSVLYKVVHDNNGMGSNDLSIFSPVHLSCCLVAGL
jgi:hypothetical protein